MIGKCQFSAAALLAAASLGILLCAGCADRPQISTTTITSVAAGSQTAPVAAADPLPPAPTSSLDAVRLGLVNRTTALIGRKAMTREEQGLGKVQDLVLELATGQVIAVVILASTDDQLTPVPARSFWTATKNMILATTDRKTFASAPRFAKADAAQALDPSRLDASFQHFGQRAPAAPPADAAGFCSAVGLVGLPLVSRSNEPLGQIADIMVDVPVGRIAYVVIQPAAGTGSPNTLFVVPPQSVRADPTGRWLVLNGDQAQFLAGPHFQRDFWTDLAQPELTAAMLQHYNLPPEVAGQPDPTRQPARTRTDSPGAPSPAPPARTDQAITAAIATEIVRISGAFPTREFKITTTQGRVTLTGRVRTESQKQQLGAAAARVVGAENVDNQLNTQPGQ